MNLRVFFSLDAKQWIHVKKEHFHKGLRNNYQEGEAVKREGAQCKLTALGKEATCKFLGKL